jgi:hypothetical protein
METVSYTRATAKLVPQYCSIQYPEQCPNGFTCTLDPDRACIQQEGVECPGICAPSCGGCLVPGPSQTCPDGTQCVSDPAKPGCLIAADCPGVCLKREKIVCFRAGSGLGDLSV